MALSLQLGSGAAMEWADEEDGVEVDEEEDGLETGQSGAAAAAVRQAEAEGLTLRAPRHVRHRRGGGPGRRAIQGAGNPQVTLPSTLPPSLLSLVAVSPSAAVWSIPHRRVLWFISNKLLSTKLKK